MLSLRQFQTFSKKILSSNRRLTNTNQVARLSPFDVDKILEANEHTQEFQDGFPVRYYETNQLSSNSPIEDSRSEAMCLSTSGLLFGVFDGHGKV